MSFNLTLSRIPTASATVAILLLCGLFSLAARRVFPLWDDGWLWMLLEEKGLDAIIDPADTRRVVARSLSAAANNPLVPEFRTGVLQT